MSTNTEQKQLVHSDAPYLNTPIFQYDSIFRLRKLLQMIEQGLQELEFIFWQLW